MEKKVKAWHCPEGACCPVEEVTFDFSPYKPSRVKLRPVKIALSDEIVITKSIRTVKQGEIEYLLDDVLDWATEKGYQAIMIDLKDHSLKLIGNEH